MEIEQLKLILETLQHTADGAKSFGVWWIALHYGVKALHLLCLVAGAWAIAWAIVKSVQICNGADSDAQRLQHLRDLMRVGSLGGVSHGEYEQMRDKVRNFMKGESK
jgi:hypothetical protein